MVFKLFCCNFVKEKDNNMLKEKDKVICIDGSALPEQVEKGIEFPIKNRIYEVQYIDKKSEGIYLKEIFNDVDQLLNYNSYKEPSFHISRFEKINDEYLQQRLTQILKEAYLENQF